MSGFDNKSFQREVQLFENNTPPYQQFSGIIDVDLSAAVRDKLIYEGAGNVVAIIARTLDPQSTELVSDLTKRFYLRVNRKENPAILMSGAADAAAGTNNLIAATIQRLYLTITAAQVNNGVHVYLIVMTGVSLGTGNSGPSGGTVVAPSGVSGGGDGSGAGAGTTTTTDSGAGGFQSGGSRGVNQL